MAQAVKFTFDSLLREDHGPRAPTKVRMVPETDLAGARETAFEEGRAAGRAEAEAGADRAVALLLQDVGAGVSRLLRDLDCEARQARVDGAALALAVARKFSARLVARMPLVETEALLAESMAEHHDEPRLVVRVNEGLVDALRERLDAIAARSNFHGRVILIGEPDFGGADCRIEWPDGGVERRAAAIDAAMDALFARFMALSQDGAAEPIASRS